MNRQMITEACCLRLVVLGFSVRLGACGVRAFEIVESISVFF